MDSHNGILADRTTVAHMDDGQLTLLAAEQGGLFTRAQTRTCGYSAKQVRHRLRTGAWQTVFGRFLSLGGMVVTPAVRDRALSLAIPGGILSGLSAARLWGIDARDPRSYIFIGTDHHPRWTDAVFMRGHLDPADIEVLDGTPITSRERTIPTAPNSCRASPQSRWWSSVFTATGSTWLRWRRGCGSRGPTRHPSSGRRP